MFCKLGSDRPGLDHSDLYLVSTLQLGVGRGAVV